MSKKYLDIVNGTSEEELDSFVDTFETPEAMDGFDPNAETGGMTPELKEETVGKIKINHGPHGDDYVWHISPHHPKSNFTQPADNIFRLCATIFKSLIPESIKVDVFPPKQDWEIKEWTFKAHGLMDCWQITQNEINKTNTELARVLSLVVDR